MAGMLTDVTACEHMLSAAESYDRLAELAEQRIIARTKGANTP